MVEMDSRLKGIILNHTLRSHTIACIESANVLNVMMRFYGGYKYKSPSKRRRDKLRKGRFLVKFRRDPILVPIPFLEPDQTPTPVDLGAPIHTAISTAFITHAEEMVDEMKRLHDKQSFLSQEAEDAEKKGLEWVTGY